MLDINALTLGELAKIEDLSGLSVEQLDEPAAPKVKLLAAILYVQKRRDGVAIAWAECLDMPFSDVSAYLGLDDDEPADDDGAEPAADDDGAEPAADDDGAEPAAATPSGAADKAANDPKSDSAKPARKTSRSSSSRSGSRRRSTGG